MGERRTSDIVILLKIEGKTHRIELFHSSKFSWANTEHSHFRIRFDGKWFPSKQRKVYSMTQIKELVFRGIIKKRKRYS